MVFKKDTAYLISDGMGLVGGLAIEIKCAYCSWRKSKALLIIKLSLVSIEDCKFTTISYEKS
jgi:hypothetical protein